MFYVPTRPPARVVRHVASIATAGAVVTVTIVTVRAFPAEAVTLATGFREGITTLLIEHLLHHWGEILVALGAAGAHHIAGD